MSRPLHLAHLRSFLFAPADHPRRAERALASAADAAILDLEDAVAPARKDEAREAAGALLSAPAPTTGSPGEAAAAGGSPAAPVPARGTSGAPARLLRINAADTPWFASDVALIAQARPDAVVLPKASVAALAALPPDCPPVYALVESAVGLREAFEIAASPRVAALMLGAVDLAADLGLGHRDDGAELLLARSQLVRDSRAAGALPPIDGVWTRLDDPAGLARDAALARDLGLRGKLCIHPAQLDAVRAAFAPGERERDWAQRVVGAYASATAQGEGAVSVDGEMVDVAVVERAQRVLRESETA
ncbi:MAG TPA: CoA ester lyase [Conexibacter sp.]|nr:CoA ester lyase [Conexibacter sp.]